MGPQQNSALDLFALLDNLSADMAGVFILLKAATYIMAIYCLWLAIKSLVELGTGQGRSQQVSKSAPIWALMTAAVLFAFPSTLEAGANTLFAGSQATNPLAYTDITARGSARLGALVPILQVIGYFFAVKGIWYLRAVGMAHNWGPGTTNMDPWKGVVQFIAGILLIHLKDLLAIIAATTGINVGSAFF
ncbi:MAG: hypothetical protein O9327_05145 [Polaromonas sp.]|nr:hypothetical protein [Polaromonas sp.]